MIYGIGTDIVVISRVELVLERYGERFVNRVLCEPEIMKYRNHRKPAAFIAKRFAAKEAFSKALGTGIRAPANWHGVWVANLPSGKPELRYSAALGALLEQRGVSRSHLSITDERDLACATVILERAA